MDLNVFDFDHDLTWAVFFLHPDERVYGRYGGRDAADAEARLSLDGLRHAMRAALDLHRAGAQDVPPRKTGAPLLAENYPAVKRTRGECIHCHQVKEAQRELAKAQGSWDRDDRWVYPLPENLGLSLAVDVGNRVRAVKPGTPAAKAGLQPGDLVNRLNGFPVASFADAQYALHRAPRAGTVPITWGRGGRALKAELELPEGWRKTNLTWRPSLLDILPSFPLYGDELTATEKAKLGLSPERLAFRQQNEVPKNAEAAGVQGGDVVVGVDDQPLEMTLEQFLGYMRRNYLVGDRVVLNLVRGGRRVDVPLTLR